MSLKTVVLVHLFWLVIFGVYLKFGNEFPDVLTPRYHEIKSGAILITGCSSGIGKVAAFDLVAKGFKVYACVRKDADVEKLKKENSNPLLVPVVLDVTNPSTINKTFDYIVAQENAGGLPLVGVVNNAGIGSRFPAEYQDMRAVMETNFFGAVAVTQKFLPLIRKHKGRIVNIGSLQSEISLPMCSAYGASKFALKAFGDSLRREVRPYGVMVSSVEPGYVLTEMSKTSEAAQYTVYDTLPEEGKQLYGAYFAKENVQQRIAHRDTRIESADTISAAISHALTSISPRARYVLNYDSAGIRLQWFVPDAMADFVMWYTQWPGSMLNSQTSSSTKKDL